MTLPTVPDTFSWTPQPWGMALECRPLADVAPHVFTTRQLELRLGGEHSDGWQAVAHAIGVDTANLVRVRQVHGRDVLVVRSDIPRHDATKPETRTKPAADAIVSNDPSTGVAVQVADCVPMLVADPKTGAVAAVHAGWRGMAGGAVPATLETLSREFGVRAGDLVAAVGPSIGPCCYEVGIELIDAFLAAGHARTHIDRWFTGPPEGGHYVQPSSLRLDLWAVARDQLVLAGLDEKNIHTCGLCTATHVDMLYSYRVEGAGTGRLAAAIRTRGR